MSWNYRYRLAVGTIRYEKLSGSRRPPKFGALRRPPASHRPTPPVLRRTAKPFVQGRRRSNTFVHAMTNTTIIAVNYRGLQQFQISIFAAKPLIKQGSSLEFEKRPPPPLLFFLQPKLDACRQAQDMAVSRHFPQCDIASILF